MKELVFLVLGLLIFPSQIQAEEYRIYKSGKPVISRYVVKSRPDGSYSVYDSRQIVVPKHTIRPSPSGDGYKIYETGKPVVPLYEVK
jgi:hypothetical protein